MTADNLDMRFAAACASTHNAGAGAFWSSYAHSSPTLVEVS